MQNKLPTFLSPKFLQTLGFGALCLVGSFVLGIQTAGEVHPVMTSEASAIEQSGLPAEAPRSGAKAGDIDGDGSITARDAIAILESVQGYVAVTPLQLRADPNGDGQLTVEDALRVLRTVAIR